jgi:glycosyltransferase involved in cell wall biosynthesis
VRIRRTAAPSVWSEPFRPVIAEAMCRGMIVVASNKGGLPELVGDAGFLA